VVGGGEGREKIYVDGRVFIPCSRAGEADGGVGAPVGLPTTAVSRRTGLDRVCGCCGTGRGSWYGPAGPADTAAAAGDDGADGGAGAGGRRTGSGGRPARTARAVGRRRCAGGGAMRRRAAVAAAAIAVADSVGGATAATAAVAAWGTSGLGTRRRPLENRRQCPKSRSVVVGSWPEAVA